MSNEITLNHPKTGEKVRFTKAFSAADEWATIHFPSGNGSTNWTEEEVKSRVDQLKEKGWTEVE